MGTAQQELSMIDTTINLEDGWKQHPCLTGCWHLEWTDPVTGFDISIVTELVVPGKPTTYEAWLPGLSDPTGHLTLDEIRGVIKYLREKHHEETYQLLCEDDMYKN